MFSEMVQLLGTMLQRNLRLLLTRTSYEFLEVSFYKTDYPGRSFVLGRKRIHFFNYLSRTFSILARLICLFHFGWESIDKFYHQHTEYRQTFVNNPFLSSYTKIDIFNKISKLIYVCMYVIYVFIFLQLQAYETE